jgi:hypothetical protein
MSDSNGLAFHSPMANTSEAHDSSSAAPHAIATPGQDSHNNHSGSNVSSSRAPSESGVSDVCMDSCDDGPLLWDLMLAAGDAAMEEGAGPGELYELIARQANLGHPMLVFLDVMRVAPNPASDSVTITFADPEAASFMRNIGHLIYQIMPSAKRQAPAPGSW